MQASETTMTSHDDLVNAHLTVMKRIEPKVLHDLELLRKAVERIDNDEAQYDGHGTRIYDYE